MTGVVLGAYAIGLVAWLTAAAAGPQSFARLQAHLQSPFGTVLMLVCTFCFFLHLCGGIRHLMWDSVRGLDLESIYLSGWIVVAMSMLFTALTWILSMMPVGWAP